MPLLRHTKVLEILESPLATFCNSIIHYWHFNYFTTASNFTVSPSYPLNAEIEHENNPSRARGSFKSWSGNLADISGLDPPFQTILPYPPGWPRHQVSNLETANRNCPKMHRFRSMAISVDNSWSLWLLERLLGSLGHRPIRHEKT